MKERRVIEGVLLSPNIDYSGKNIRLVIKDGEVKKLESNGVDIADTVLSVRINIKVGIITIELEMVD